MAKRERGDPIALFVEHQTGADFDDGQRIVGPRAAEAQRGVNEFFYSCWSVDRQRQRIPLHRAAAQQPGQAEQMVAVQMGNKDLIQFARMMGRMQKLMLGPSPQSNNHISARVGCCKLSIIDVILRVRVGTPADVPKKVNSIVQCPQGESQNISISIRSSR